jgi:probable DNA metabolism protein
MLTVYLCDDTFECILCGVYEAGSSGLGHGDVRLALAEGYAFGLLEEAVRVTCDSVKSEKVERAIVEKISWEAYEAVYMAALSPHCEKADRIYRYLVEGFKYGRKVVNMLQLDAVAQVFALQRAVTNEANHLTGFVRFSQNARGVLISRIHPKGDCIALLADHFADRLRGENWLIYDGGRHKAVVCAAGRGWFVTDMSDGDWGTLSAGADDTVYESLWQAFFESIAIRERINPKLQRGNLPLRFQRDMTEFRRTNASPRS